MVMNVSQIKPTALNATTQMDTLLVAGEGTISSGYVTSPNGFKFTFANTNENRVAHTSQVGTRKRATRIGQLRVRDDRVVSVNL